MGEITMYTKTGCPFCQQAKEDYEEQGIEFEEINLSENEEKRSMVKEKYDVEQVPVIVEEGELVSIGYEGGG